MSSRHFPFRGASYDAWRTHIPEGEPDGCTECGDDAHCEQKGFDHKCACVECLQARGEFEAEYEADLEDSE